MTHGGPEKLTSAEGLADKVTNPVGELPVTVTVHVLEVLSWKELGLQETADVVLVRKVAVIVPGPVTSKVVLAEVVLEKLMAPLVVVALHE
jgi:hypothetical protein